jgi:tetratricopeptide (TPR) repeat protein
MTKKITIALTLMCFTFAFSAFGIDIENDFKQYKLKDAEVSKLNDDAKKEYDAGIELLDRVMYDQAIKRFVKAAEAQPDHAGLKFIVARLATYQGRVATLDSDPGSDEYLSQAEKAYAEIKDLDNLTAEQKKIAADELRTVEFLIRSQKERDGRRSRMLKKNLNKQIPPPVDEDDKDKEKKDDRINLEKRELERVL